MDHRFETFSLSILELNRYLQKIKELEMKQFGLKASHTMCLYYLGQHPESSASSRQITSGPTARATCLPFRGAPL